MINSFQNKRALLIGNGINRIDPNQAISWGDLLNELKNQYGIDVDLDNEFKPFPIGFEEMRHQKKGGSSLEKKLKNLKTSIREIIDDQLRGKSGYNQFHTKMMGLGYKDILTTNYDYALEKSIMSDDFKTNKREYAVNKLERKFSLKRRYKMPLNNSFVWHIHGELESPRNITSRSNNYPEESIMIGYEHYSDYLEHIQENINGKKGKRISENQSIISRLKSDSIGDFWTDIFFTHHIDIVGLGLDFSENHLWWLLNKRATLIRNNPSNIEDGKVVINNEINYYYPVLENDNTFNFNQSISFNEMVKKKNSFDKAKAIADVLKSFKVNPKPIVCNSHRDFYNKFLNNRRNNTN